RRLLEHHGKHVFDLTAGECMTRSPKVVGPEIFAIAALDIMEQKKITSLPVIPTEDFSPSGRDLRFARCYLLLHKIKRASSDPRSFGRLLRSVSQYPLLARFFRIIGLGKTSPQIIPSKEFTSNLNFPSDLQPRMARRSAYF